MNRLSGEGRDFRVERKVMQLLVCLAADAGRPVTRRRLLDQLWGYHVSDDALHSVVAKLRRALDPDAAAMDRVNPVHVPRNHLLQAALDAADAGDLAPFERVLEVVTHPFDERPEWADLTQPGPDDGSFVTYCGT